MVKEDFTLFRVNKNHSKQLAELAPCLQTLHVLLALKELKLRHPPGRSEPPFRGRRER